jgi:hypothetical protein
MRIIKIITIAGIALLTSFCSSTDNDSIIENEIQETSNIVLTEDEINDLQFIIEEEKLARDVYLNSYNIYGLKIFKNISTSEQSHMKSVENLLNKYNITNPISNEIGIFKNPNLQELYTQLTNQSSISLTEALIVGNTIEDLDIYDLGLNEGRTSKEDILAVYASLKCGSRNHLRNYYSQLINNNGSYSPQYINENLFNEIINSSNESCNNN